MPERKQQEKPEVYLKEDYPKEDPDGGSTTTTETPAVQTNPPRGGDGDES